jgi:hypothetical protein
VMTGYAKGPDQIAVLTANHVIVVVALCSAARF